MQTHTNHGDSDARQPQRRRPIEIVCYTTTTNNNNNNNNQHNNSRNHVANPKTGYGIAKGNHSKNVRRWHCDYWTATTLSLTLSLFLTAATNSIMFLIYFAPHNPAPGFTRGLPVVSKLLEFRLYQKSTSRQEYMDENSFAARVVEELHTLRHCRLQRRRRRRRRRQQQQQQHERRSSSSSAAATAAAAQQPHQQHYEAI